MTNRILLLLLCWSSNEMKTESWASVGVCGLSSVIYIIHSIRAYGYYIIRTENIIMYYFYTGPGRKVGINHRLKTVIIIIFESIWRECRYILKTRDGRKVMNHNLINTVIAAINDRRNNIITLSAGKRT